MTQKSSKLPNRIAAADLKGMQGWQLPSIDSAGNILSSAEKEERERRKLEKLRANEVVEDVADPRIPAGPMTAELLQEITDSAEAEGFEQGRKKGEEAGRLEGYEAGKQQALQEMRQQLREETERLSMIANTLNHPLAVQDDGLEFLLLQMVQKLTASLVRRELQTDSSHILAVVQEAVAALPVGSNNLSLYLNPDDLVLVENYADEQQKDWRFIGDANLLPGGCRVETGESLVDFSIETRLQELLKNFETKQLAGDDEAIIAEAEQQARLHRQHRDAEKGGAEFVAGQVSDQLMQKNLEAPDQPSPTAAADKTVAEDAVTASSTAAAPDSDSADGDSEPSLNASEADEAEVSATDMGADEVADSSVLDGSEIPRHNTDQNASGESDELNND